METFYLSLKIPTNSFDCRLFCFYSWFLVFKWQHSLFYAMKLRRSFIINEFVDILSSSHMQKMCFVEENPKNVPYYLTVHIICDVFFVVSKK